MAPSTCAIAGVAALLLSCAAADGLYMKGSPVLQIDAKKYYSDIAQSNHTSIVEFYAPWCGHCKNLKPAYEKAARSLSGLAKVAAVNCDEEANKPFCGGMDVKGFPTLKIVKPGKKAGRPFVEDYNGPRNAKGIVEAVKDKITNHVKRLTDSTAQSWLEADKDKPKAILFTEKGTTSALLKALAIDYLDVLPIAQIRDKEKATAEKYGVTTFPTFVLFPASGGEPIKYDGDLQKAAMSKFLSQAATPNPDPAPKKAKSKPGKPASAKSDSSKLSKAPAAHASSEDGASSAATQGSETLVSEGAPTESPDPIPDPDAQKPIKLDTPPAAPPALPILTSDAEVRRAALTTKSGTSVLLFVPADDDQTSDNEAAAAAATRALSALTQIRAKLADRGGKVFPFYKVALAQGAAAQDDLRKGLGVDGASGLGLVAVNGKKGWVKRFQVAAAAAPADGNERGWDRSSIEGWVDSIRMGEGKKEKLAEGLVVSPAAAEAAAAEEGGSGDGGSKAEGPKAGEGEQAKKVDESKEEDEEEEAAGAPEHGEL